MGHSIHVIDDSMVAGQKLEHLDAYTADITA